MLFNSMGGGASVPQQPAASQLLLRQASTHILNASLNASLGVVSVLNQAVQTSIHLAQRYISSPHPWHSSDWRASDLRKMSHSHLSTALLLAELSHVVYSTAAPTHISKLPMPLRFKLGDLYQRNLLNVPSGHCLKPLTDPFVMNQTEEEITSPDSLNIINGIFRSASGRISGMLLELDEAHPHNQATTKSIVLIFCGSQALSDTLSNSQCWLVPDPTGGKGSVHAGFASAYNEIRVSFLHQIRQLFATPQQSSSGRRYGTQKLFIGGHSLGGVFATLVAKDLCSNAVPTMDVDDMVVCTYGSPKVGDAVFQREYSSCNTTTFRFVHGNDVVPAVPPEWLGFSHVGQEIYLDGNGMWWKGGGGGSGGSTSNPRLSCVDRDVVMGQVVVSDNGEDPLEMFAAPRANVVAAEATPTTTTTAAAAAAATIVQGRRATTRLEQFVDTIKSKPIVDHRIMSYVHHLQLLLVHHEVNEKRLNEISKLANCWSVPGDVGEEVEEEDDNGGAVAAKLGAMWQRELTAEEEGGVTVQALVQYFLDERVKTLKGQNNNSTTRTMFGDALICGWKLFYDTNEARRKIAHRFVIRTNTFLTGIGVQERWSLEEAVAILFALKQNPLGGGGSGGERKSNSKICKEEKESMAERLSELGVDVEAGIGREEMLLWDLSYHCHRE